MQTSGPRVSPPACRHRSVPARGAAESTLRHRREGYAAALTIQIPIAAAAGFGNVRNDPDLATPKLAALHLYQLSLQAPEPPAAICDRKAAKRGKVLFNGKADCARCHVPPLFTEPGWNMHTAQDIGINDFQAERAPDQRYRTAPLKGLWTHTKGGFCHDGRFRTLKDSRLRGVLLWNVWEQVEAARRLISNPGPFSSAGVRFIVAVNEAVQAGHPVMSAPAIGERAPVGRVVVPVQPMPSFAL